jgi:hypothetical protein
MNNKQMNEFRWTIAEKIMDVALDGPYAFGSKEEAAYLATHAALLDAAILFEIIASEYKLDSAQAWGKVLEKIIEIGIARRSAQGRA